MSKLTGGYGECVWMGCRGLTRAWWTFFFFETRRTKIEKREDQEEKKSRKRDVGDDGGGELFISCARGKGYYTLRATAWVRIEGLEVGVQPKLWESREGDQERTPD